MVSGVSRGIGAEVANSLLAAGHQVYGVVRPDGGQIDGLAGTVDADLAHPEDLDRAVLGFADDLGPIDGLLHSAGIVPGSTLSATSAEDLSAQFTVNVTAVAELTRHVSLRPRHPPSTR